MLFWKIYKEMIVQEWKWINEWKKDASGRYDAKLSFPIQFTPLVLLIIYLIYLYISPLTPMSDQDRISPYNINTISTR